MSTSDVPETEEELISKAQSAVSQCNWVVGECALKWTKKYARGRTDADFAGLVGLSPDQVYQRRRVWETFGDVLGDYASLKWSHFYISLNWDDAPESLQWADENTASVAEMRAWRRAQRGEDLTALPPPDDWAGDPTVSFIPREPTEVRDPDEFADSGRSPADDRGRSAATQDARVDAVAGVARESDDGSYSPYRQGAGSPAPREQASDVAVAVRPSPSPEHSLKRMTAAIERINRTMTPELTRGCRKLPDKLRDRFVKAVAELSSKAAELM